MFGLDISYFTHVTVILVLALAIFGGIYCKFNINFFFIKQFFNTIINSYLLNF